MNGNYAFSYMKCTSRSVLVLCLQETIFFLALKMSDESLLLYVKDTRIQQKKGVFRVCYEMFVHFVVFKRNFVNSNHP